MAEAFKLYKLIILYMLDKVDFPLTNSPDFRIHFKRRLHDIF